MTRKMKGNSEAHEDIVTLLSGERGIFSLFEQEDLRAIAPYFDTETFPAGSVIFREGDPPEYVAFVKKGKVEVKKETEFHGKQIVIGQMHVGSVFGEIALFDDQNRSATAMALEDTVLLILRREAIDSFIEAHPALGIKILKGISRVLSIRLRQLTERLVVIF